MGDAPLFIQSDPALRCNLLDYERAGRIYHMRAYAQSLNVSSLPEWLAYRIFGPSLIGTLALALDPIEDYRFPIDKPTPANRTRRGASVRSRGCGMYTTTWTDTVQTVPDLTTLYQFDRLIKETPGTPSVSFSGRPTQEFIPAISHDTTKRSRGVNSEGGEFDSFRFIFPQEETAYTLSGLTQRQWTGGSPQDFDFTTGMFKIARSGGNFRILASECEAFKTSETAFAESEMTKRYMSLLTKADPLRKEFDVAYNLYELRELPRMLLTTVEWYKRMWDAKESSSQFLNYEFGWKQTVAQIKNMLALPQRIAKRVNYLISRQGKLTTFRAKEKFSSAPTFSTIPKLYFDFHFWEGAQQLGTLSAKREYELRVAVNLLVNFPKLEVPILRGSLVNKLLGYGDDFPVTPSTVYNMVPWTWLVDWFTGMGDYITMMDEIALDRKLVNWAYITYQCDGVVSNTARCTFSQRYLEMQNGVTLADKWNEYPLVFPGKLRWRHTVRKDLATLGGLKTTSDLSSLAGRQLAIISALLAQRR
jgi:hypothetical protein